MTGNRGIRLGSGASALVGILLAGCGTETARSALDTGAGAGATGGGAAASVGTGGASGGGASGGSAGACAAPTACLGTMTGPWCVEQLPTATTQSASGVWSDRPDDVWVTGGRGIIEGGVVSSTDGFVLHFDGCTWSKSPLPSAEPGLNAIWGADANNIWAVGQHGIAVNWDGKYWSNAPVGADISLKSVSGSSASDVWTTGGFHWDGLRWTQAPGGALTHDVWAVSPTNAWATAGLTATFQIPDVARWDGHTWNTTQVLDPTMTGFSIFAIWGGVDTAWAVGEGEMILHYANGVWTTVQQPGGSSQGFIDVMQEGADVYAVGQDVAHSVNGGPFQIDTDVARLAFWSSVWISSSQVWVVGNGVAIHRAR